MRVGSYQWYFVLLAMVFLGSVLEAQAGSPAGPVPPETLQTRRAQVMEAMGTGVAILGSAAARSIENGDRVRVFNRLGEVFCKVLVVDRVREGVVHMPKGAWMKTSENGRTATALCPDDISEEGGGACFNDARVEVEKA